MTVFHDDGSAIFHFGSPDAATLANFGTIVSGSTEQTLLLGTDRNTVINHGPISNIAPSAISGVVFERAGGDSIGGFFGAVQTIINHGDINGTTRMFNVNDAIGRFDLDLDNMGSMIASGNIVNRGSFMVNADITKPGTLIGGTIDAAGMGAAEISNSGSLRTESFSFAGNFGGELHNTGELIVRGNNDNGLLQGAEDTDIIENHGAIVANIMAFGGDDVLLGDFGGDDRLDVSALGFGDFASLSPGLGQTGNDVTFFGTNANGFILQDVDLATLDASDFIF